MRARVKTDKAIHNGVAAMLTSNDPKLPRFESYWGYLNEIEKDEFLAMIKLRAENSMRRRNN